MSALAMMRSSRLIVDYPLPGRLKFVASPVPSVTERGPFLWFGSMGKAAATSDRNGIAPSRRSKSDMLNVSGVALGTTCVGDVPC